MLGRQKCVGCGRVSPETNGEITLTTSFGWRIRRNPQATADAQTEWRCPACWQKFKASQHGEGLGTVPPSSNDAKDRGHKP